MRRKRITAEEATNWFFTVGYKELAKNQDAATQSVIGSAFSRVMRVAELMELSPSDVLILTLEGKMNGKKKG